MITAPIVIAMSATLNVGHSGGSMKSVTEPSLIRSIRLPSAPPAMSPAASHRPGLLGLRQNQTSTSPRASTVTAITSAPPPPRKPNATPVFFACAMRKPRKEPVWWPVASDERTTALDDLVDARSRRRTPQAPAPGTLTD